MELSKCKKFTLFLSSNVNLMNCSLVDTEVKAILPNNEAKYPFFRNASERCSPQRPVPGAQRTQSHTGRSSPIRYLFVLLRAFLAIPLC